jgi:hypothetical protein
VTYRRPAKICGRCQRRAPTGRNWPEGFVCARCLRHGVLRHGWCPGCGTERALPGLDKTGEPICGDCAGIPTSFRCTTCGVEDESFYARTCLRCSLRRRLSGILDDGSGAVAPTLVAFLEAMCSMPEPRRGLKWLGSAQVRHRLCALATGAVPLTHAGVDTLEPGTGREYLRELLMVHGVLPVVDKHLMAFERWEVRRLETIDDPVERQTIRVYLRWRHRRELEARSAAGSLTTTSDARRRTNAGVKFLQWLRQRGVTLDRCSQADLDAWFASTSNPYVAVDFLCWAMRQRRCPQLVVPQVRRRAAVAAGAESHRVEQLARVLADGRLSLGDRVAAGLVLLFAQQITRVCALRVTDVDAREGEVQIHFGGHSLAVPEPLGALVLEHIAHRRRMTSAANPSSLWMFPGNCPGQHVGSGGMSRRMAKLGVTEKDRQAALQRLIREVPAPLVASALGFHPSTVTRWSAVLGADWSAYAGLKARQTTRST